MALGYILVAKPVYEASTRLVIRQLPPAFDNASAPRPSDKVFLATQAEVIRSPRTIERALELTPFVGDPGSGGPVEAVSESLRVNPLVSTDVVRVSYQDHDPGRAIQRLESLVESYREQLRAAEQSSATESLALLEARDVELSSQIRDVQTRMQALHDEQPLDAAAQSGEESALLQELSSRWAASQSNLARLEAAVNSAADDAPTFAASDLDLEAIRNLADLRSELARARALRDESRAVYGPEHPDRTRAERRVAALEEEFAEERRGLQDELRRQSTRFEAEARELTGLMEQERVRLRSAGAARLEDERLRTQLAQLTELQTATTATLESVRLADRALAEGRGLVQVDVLDGFEPPRSPVWPLALPLVLASTLLGGFLALGAVVWMSGGWALGDAFSQGKPWSSPDLAALGQMTSLEPEVDVLHRARDLQTAIQHGPPPAVPATST